MSRALDVVTLTGEEYDDLMECKEMVTSLLAQLSAAKDRIAELTPVAGMDWRETMQRMLTRMEETDRWQPIETAPKDGSYVLLAGKRREDIASGYWLQYAYAGNGAWIWPFVLKDPTHWMPLPKAPAMQEDKP